ncbi:MULTISPECIES: molybdopterin molybdotransferase MoeA [Gordonibacter]|uniref:Molybdopterin molybdenumtransferase n=1 Tax=Gordonibacter faecis TaxID=3047475 RepID=A0ABT7DM91_9ACTN|nr:MULTISPECIES: gephyrin-like molybdotransferase Glp [unclassified Gordonibacter]MDJ1650372.1 molybdopterin molybdotransferase MoeA [Gordonibacter sp. KGMB12511]HIW76783.1 molybdopterin molybdotransferase MoeA [Candidatus Gordonibacter avicola]
MKEMISVEEARDLVLAHVDVLPVETVPVLEAVGRVAAADLTSDIDISPFAHSAMDGFAVRAAELAEASDEAPVQMDVIAEVAAGDVYEGPIEAGQCVRIMTGAPLPDDADAVVKYEIVDVVDGDGKPGSRVAFRAPAKERANVREAGEEAKAGETVVEKGEVIGSAGVGFLAGCGVVEVPTHRRPRVAIISIGSELVDPTEVPTPGKIRNSNSYALAACAQAAGAEPVILPIVEDTMEALAAAVSAAVDEYDFVVTSGGASNGDFDFIKPVVDELGELLMTTVNMRPGKAQTFGVVRGTPVFGLPGNPAAAYVGFEMIIRPALRKMQGYHHFERPRVKAKLSRDVKKNDPRRIFLRGTLYRDEDGEYVVAPAKNQSSGLFGVIQRSNCMAIMPEGLDSRTAGSVIECVLLDVSEEVSL